MTIEELIETLRKIEETPDITLFDSEYILRDKPVVLEASNLAETVLITPNGQCNWGAIEVLRQNGYDVFAVERDRFGWLIGGIVTSVGILTYG